MKIIQINSSCGTGSTGKICVSVSKLLTRNGIENYIFYTSVKSSYELGRRYSNKPYTKIQSLFSRIYGNYGFNSVLVTKKLIKEIKKLSPDIVHLHNIHGHNVNLKMLFDFFKVSKIKLYWTFHDCWAFTGYCPHFTMVGCDKWIDGCYDCEQKSYYSWFFDKSASLYERKKQLFTGLDLTIITPSQWLCNLVKKSFLKDYPVKVINNGIDLSIFKPTESDFRRKYGLGDKKILLGVAFDWGVRKGLDVFVELSKTLDESYKIVLVGTNDEIDKQLPKNIISIHRTANQRELAEIYTSADIFINPTREENYPTVNMESLACGTPVITFNTGGSPEIIDDTCGIVTKTNDAKGMLDAIAEMVNSEKYTKELCLERARSFDQNERFEEYAKEYNA